MISCFLKVDVVIEHLIALGKELKIVTMDEFKRLEVSNCVFMLLSHKNLGQIIRTARAGKLPMKIRYA